MRFILGRSVSGKSERVRQEIGECLAAGGEDKLLLLVPEQFTLQSERDLITRLNLPGIIRVEVLSFTRLAHKVFSQVGGLTRTLLNEQGKNMVLRKMIDEVAGELTVYKKAALQEGFVAKLSELFSNFKTQDITPAQLQASLVEDDLDTIKQKIHDISLIYEQFNHYLEGSYLDTEDYLNLLIEKIQSAAFLAGTRIWVDGFSTFSPQSLKIINKLIPQVQEITITLTLDPAKQTRDQDLFSLTSRTYRQLQAMAREQGVTQESIDLDQPAMDENHNSAILFVEKELFAYPSYCYRGGIQDIELFAAANINSEVEYAAAQVWELVRERGWRWQDIAVVCNDMESYGPLIKRVFAEYGIPTFMDQKRDIMDNSIVKLILSSGHIIRRGYRYEDVFSFLKTGFSGLNDDQVEKLENFALQYGIQGSAWQQEFIVEDPEINQELNTCREMFIRPLQKLGRKIAGTNPIADICRAHYEYLQEISVQPRLEQWIEKMNDRGRLDIVRENTQIWNVVLQIFDQMVEILGDNKVSLKEYLHILEAGFMSLEVGIIPTTIDQVLVGNIQRSKSQDVKALLVLGVNDGILPSGPETEGILSESEQVLLQKRGVELGFDKNQQSTEEKFLIYTALSKPSRYLALSYALADEGGKALRPSLLVYRLQRLFPQLAVRSDVIRDPDLELHQITTPASTYKYLVGNMRLLLDAKPVEPCWGHVYSWYQGQEQWQQALQAMQAGLFHSNQIGVIGADKASQLYSLPLYSSVSRVEKFIGCPFAHFIHFGLKPQERKVYQVAAPDIGELFHNGLMEFAGRLQRENKSWRELERSEAEGIMDGIMDDIVPAHNHGVFTSNHRYQYLVQRLKRISRRTVWVLTQHLQQGGFEPLQYEVSFGPGGLFPAIEIELAQGQKLYLVGRIDRVDFLEEDDATYVKIIDYKSGNHDFKLSDVFHGISLQLMIYMQAVLAGATALQRGQLKPGGVFYFKIDDPLINTETAVIENIEQEIGKKFKMKGLVLKDTQLVTQLDKDIAGNSDIIPVAMTVKGDFYKNSAALSLENFTALLQHVERLLAQIGREIARGQVKIHPYKSGQHTACDYCEYLSVCQFDQLLVDNNYRYIKPLSDEEVINRINHPQEVNQDAKLD